MGLQFSCKVILLFFLLVIIGGCQVPPNNGLISDNENEKDQLFFIDKSLNVALKQYELLTKKALSKERIPRTISKENEIHWTNRGFDWTEGFYPGTLWYLYELTRNKKWRSFAENFQSYYESHKFKKSNHDLGFVFNCSVGNGYRITKNPAFKNTMIEAGNSLISRFNKQVGSIQSWDVDKGWQAKRGWKFPVIIDNMMNLELLFELSKITGNPKYQEIAVTHANTALKNHFRPDNSSWHVIDYDPFTGKVRGKHTAQGYSNESSWARGQAWGLYGFTVCYRYTKNPVYLDQAKKIADFIIKNDKIEVDRIPYWDYDAPNIPKEPRDASAAAITASALIEFNNYYADNKYWDYSIEILKSLSSEEYLAEIGTNHNFILKHSVGSIPHNNEIDVPLNYADYYFIEALLRCNNNRDSKFSQNTSNVLEKSSLYWDNYLKSRKDRTDLYNPLSQLDSRFIPNNFSYAGYHHSDIPLPQTKDLKDYKKFDVTDYGAIPNDLKSDKESIRLAMDAITRYKKENKKGTILYFPEGRFIINDDLDMAKIDPVNSKDLKEKQAIILNSSNFIIQGADQVKTILWMAAPLYPTIPSKKWSTPYLLQIGSSGMESSVETKIVRSQAAGSSKSVHVKNSALFKSGDYVEINGQVSNIEKIKRAIEPYDLEVDPITKDFIWKDLTSGLNKFERHQIVKIDNNILVFAAPIAHHIDHTDQWTVKKIFPAEEIGIENLTIAGNWNESFVHHKNALHDSGYSLLKFRNAANSWIRNVHFKDFSLALNWQNTFNLTAKDILFSGAQGHGSFSIQRSNNNISKNVKDHSNSWHAPGFSKYSISNVHLFMSYDPTSTSDLHGQQSMHNLFDNTAGGWVRGRWGGAVKNQPNHLEGLFYWNHRNTGESVQNFELVASEGLFGRMIMPHIVGLHGNPITFQNQKYFSEKVRASGRAAYNQLLPEEPQAFLEFLGQRVLPVSLYEAQLKYRKELNSPYTPN